MFGDKRRLMQVLINLVKNALKFTNRGTIRIAASYIYEEQKLFVRVIDSGAGISQDEMPNLFRQFGKLKRTASQNSQGIGLGLMISKQIVEQCNGEITVESGGVGHGSVFSFSMQMEDSKKQRLSQTRLDANADLSEDEENKSKPLNDNKVIYRQLVPLGQECH